MLHLVAPAHRPVAVYAQSVAAAVLTRLGYQIAVPQDVTLPFDLLVSCDPELRAWSKVQIKESSRDGVVGLRRGDKRRGCKRYEAGDFDLLVVVDVAAGVFAIPYRMIQHRRSQVCVREPAFRHFRVTAPLPAVERAMPPSEGKGVEWAEQLSMLPADAA